MKVKQLGTNMTLVYWDSDNEALFSYETPVAGRNGRTGVYFESGEKFSPTTSRHINKYFAYRQVDRKNVKIVPQEAIDLFCTI